MQEPDNYQDISVKIKHIVAEYLAHPSVESASTLSDNIRRVIISGIGIDMVDSILLTRKRDSETPSLAYTAFLQARICELQGDRIDAVAEYEVARLLYQSSDSIDSRVIRRRISEIDERMLNLYYSLQSREGVIQCAERLALYDNNTSISGPSRHAYNVIISGAKRDLNAGNHLRELLNSVEKAEPLDRVVIHALMAKIRSLEQWIRPLVGEQIWQRIQDR